MACLVSQPSPERSRWSDRLRTYLAVVFGAELVRRSWSVAWWPKADATLDKRAARDGSLEAWVGDRAFRQHCTLFGQRPFLWHISDETEGRLLGLCPLSPSSIRPTCASSPTLCSATGSPEPRPRTTHCATRGAASCNRS